MVQDEGAGRLSDVSCRPGAFATSLWCQNITANDLNSRASVSTPGGLEALFSSPAGLPGLGSEAHSRPPLTEEWERAGLSPRTQI